MRRRSCAITFLKLSIRFIGFSIPPFVAAIQIFLKINRLLSAFIIASARAQINNRSVYFNKISHRSSAQSIASLQPPVAECLYNPRL
jgi:hypothetical protein